jgi:predicted nucleic acid-binding protein
MRAILDTSVIVAEEQGRELATERLPDAAAVSTVTLAELEIGVRTSRTRRIRQQRVSTLRRVRARFVALPIDEQVASAFAKIATSTGRPRRYADVQDMWIAATAKAHGAMLFTQDGDFERFAGVEVVRV